MTQLTKVFGITTALAQWMVVGYMLVIGLVLPFAGILMKWFKTRSLTLFALGAFFVGSLMSAYAPSFGFALAGRLIQGIGTGLVLPMMPAAKSQAKRPYSSCVPSPKAARKRLARASVLPSHAEKSLAERTATMNVSQALEHASALFFPEIVYCEGFPAMDAERQKNEEAMTALRDEYAKNDNPGFSYDVIRDLADRNRDLCDQIGIERLANTRDHSLSRGMSDEDLCRGVAALQKRRASTVIREVHGDRSNLAIAYVTRPIKGTVFGIDIETTDRYPDRGYIINVGFETMELTDEAEPEGGEAHFFGIPEMYAEKGVPLERIHHIGWADVEGKVPFRENKVLQAKLLKLMKKYPVMAHNAAFEDSWFTLHLDGYAEARRAGKITIVDSRDICRQLDPEVKTLPRESSPASLENWARRRGTLASSEAEVHQGLDDTHLMLKTVQAEFIERNCFRS